MKNLGMLMMCALCVVAFCSAHAFQTLANNEAPKQMEVLAEGAVVISDENGAAETAAEPITEAATEAPNADAAAGTDAKPEEKAAEADVKPAEEAKPAENAEAKPAEDAEAKPADETEAKPAEEAKPAPKMWIGIGMGMVPNILRTQIPADKLAEDSGVFVHQVMPNSPAEKAGLKPFDILVKVAGKEAKSPNDVAEAVQLSKGDKLALDVLRMGAVQTVELTPEPMPEEIQQMQVPPMPRHFRGKAHRMPGQSKLQVVPMEEPAPAEEQGTKALEAPKDTDGTEAEAPAEGAPAETAQEGAPADEAQADEATEPKNKKAPKVWGFQVEIPEDVQKMMEGMDAEQLQQWGSQMQEKAQKMMEGMDTEKFQQWGSQMQEKAQKMFEDFQDMEGFEMPQMPMFQFRQQMPNMDDGDADVQEYSTSSVMRSMQMMLDGKPLSIQIQQNGDEPTKIKVQWDGKTYETTDDKLDVIPEKVRGKVQQFLDGGKVIIEHSILPQQGEEPVEQSAPENENEIQIDESRSIDLK